MTVKIEVLVQKGEMSAEAAQRLKERWITTADELYSSVRAAVSEDESSELRKGIAGMLEVDPGKLNDYMRYLEAYVSEQVINPGEIKRYPLGYPIGPQKGGNQNV